MSYKGNIVSNFGTQILRIIVGFIVSILVARTLGPIGQGKFTYLLLVFGLLSNYGHLGINNATVYFQKRSEYSQEEIFNVNITYLIIISIIIGLVVTIFHYFNLIMGEYQSIAIIIGSIFVLINLVSTCIKSFYIGNENIIQLNYYLIMEIILHLVLTVTFISLDKLDVNQYFLIRTVIFVVPLIPLIRKLKFRYKASLNLKLLLDEYKYGIIIYFSSLFIFLNYRADQFLIKQIIGVSQLGLYSIGVMLAELVFLIPISVQTALEARLYNMDKFSNDRMIITKTTIKYTIYICIVLIIIGFLMTPLIPIVYGKEFTQAKLVTMILFIGVLFASVGKVSAPYFFSQGRPIVHLSFSFLSFIINGLMNLLLIPKYGIYGAALASTISYFVYGGMYILYFIKKEPFDLKDFFFFSKSDISIIKGYLLKKTKK